MEHSAEMDSSDSKSDITFVHNTTLINQMASRMRKKMLPWTLVKRGECEQHCRPK
jgi:hypothetical protein